MTMVTIGTMLGRVLGTLAGRRAEVLGGIVLMLVGATILYEHLADEYDDNNRQQLQGTRPRFERLAQPPALLWRTLD